jgi:hypothetical protein
VEIDEAVARYARALNLSRAVTRDTLAAELTDMLVAALAPHTDGGRSGP